MTGEDFLELTMFAKIVAAGARTFGAVTTSLNSLKFHIVGFIRGYPVEVKMTQEQEEEMKKIEGDPNSFD